VTLQDVLRRSTTATTTGETTAAVTEAEEEDEVDGPESNATDDHMTKNSNPFAFLNEDTTTTTSSSTATQTQPPPFSSSKPSKPGLGRFLKKVAASTTQSLERGMHSLAVKATGGGKQPDHFVVAIYDAHNPTHLIHVSEAEPMLLSIHGLRFRIPCSIPARVQAVNIHLYIRSGAALVSSKHYLLGKSRHPIDLQKLRQDLTSAPKTHGAATPRVVWNVPLQSPYLLDASLECVAIRDPKLPPICGRGWFLQDPVTANAMFHLPLDQSYALSFPVASSSLSLSPKSFLWATERTVESTVVLPIAAAVATLAAHAAQVSVQCAEHTRHIIHQHRHDTPVGPEYADVQIAIGHLSIANTATTTGMDSSNNNNNKAPVTVSVNFQRPNSIFEVEIVPPTPVPLHPTNPPPIACQFYPKPVREGIVPAFLTQPLPPGGFRLGNVRLQIQIPRGSGSNSTTAENPFDAYAKAKADIGESGILECIIPLEDINSISREYPVVNASGHVMGTIFVSIRSSMQTTTPPPPVPSQSAAASTGLVAMMGLTDVLGISGMLPLLDFDDPVSGSTVLSQDQQRRRSQLSTMGYFVTHPYLDQHLEMVRRPDLKLLQERATAYQQALGDALVMDNNKNNDERMFLTSYQDRTPKPFRPSSSRSTVLLSGIGFNVHTASLSLEVIEPGSSGGGSAAVFHNITCGAPADHARGFGNVFAPTKETRASAQQAQPSYPGNSPVPASGGLRRLKAARNVLAEEIMGQQMMLTMSIANYFMEQRKQRPVTHVPANHVELQQLRWKLFESVQCLHHLTWTCAMRQASVFSQALGVAVSSYLSALSDPDKLQGDQRPHQWVRHGYLVSYEGLLSAAGKELGMIEDASAGIDMLRLVRIVLVPDDGKFISSRVPSPFSAYLKWIHLSATPPPPGASPEYVVQIGIVPSYYDQRIPQPLKNGSAVRFYPILFEVGVDIFQAAANAGSNMSKNMSSTANCEPETAESILDEEDDTGVTDEDELVQLNYEAFQKLEAYAQAVAPAAPIQATSTYQTHPLLVTLFQHIVSSSGKMNHDILDEAAILAQQLGGGGVVFCKSGKDRTAMHVTYKQAQFAYHFKRQQMQKQDPNTANGSSGDGGSFDVTSDVAASTILQDARLLRLYGTRLPICEKNVGQAKYAFNSLQVKFMPEALKPPSNALAGFLKGGKVFGGGGIES
jgi:hypothetical protein